MYKNKKILAIIPARGGSKGLPGKNIKKFNEKPLIGWTIDSAKLSKYIDKFYVSTDCKVIAKTVEKLGESVPIMRPKKFAKDESPSWQLIIHALEYFKNKGETYDYVALLEPTSPLRKDDDIDRAISLLINNPKADCLVSIGEVHTEHPDITKKIDKDGFIESYYPQTKNIFQRQQVSEAFFPYGVIYISKVDSFYKNKSFYVDKLIGYKIERWQNFEIDDDIDFKINECLFKKYKL